MRIIFQSKEGKILVAWDFPHLRYSDPQVRYELGKVRGWLNLLEQKGKENEDEKRRNLAALDDPTLNLFI